MTATNATSHVRFIAIPPESSQPHVIGAGHPDLHQLLHQVRPLPPQIQRFQLFRLTLGELPVDGRDAVFERRRQRGFPPAHHPSVTAAAHLLQGRFERRRALERQQIVHCAVHHPTSIPAPSVRRNFVCARASWDFEKLTDLPIISAISSCVYPSTSCSHTTARPVSLSSCIARSRSSVWPTLCAARPAMMASSNTSASRTCSRRIRIRALVAAICRIQPHRWPSPRYCPMLRTTSRNVSWSTSSASSALRSMRRARL